jgi:RNA polymerase sigma factor (sigma-70 family)
MIQQSLTGVETQALAAVQGLTSSKGINEEKRAVIDDESFAAAYKRGFLSTLRLLRSIGARADAAEEVAQAAWARGWQYRYQLLNPEALGSWINAIARNLYRAKIVGENRFEELADKPVANRVVLQLEAKDLMDACNERESEILTLFYVEGYSILEIAEKVRMQPTTVRVRLLRIRRSLRARLETPRSFKLTARAA